MLIPPAEFRVKRLALGIQPRDIVRIHNVSKRTVAAWEKESYAPIEVAMWLENLWQDYLKKIDQALDLIEQSDGAPLVLQNFTPHADLDTHMREVIAQRVVAAAYTIATLEDLPVEVMQLKAKTD